MDDYDFIPAWVLDFSYLLAEQGIGVIVISFSENLRGFIKAAQLANVAWLGNLLSDFLVQPSTKNLHRF